LNKSEAKERARKEKGKGKAVESGWKGLQGADGEVPGVRQNLGTIMQKNTFVAEDVQQLDDLFVGPAAAEDEQDEAEAEEDEEDEPADEEEELTWNDVWEGIKEDTTEIPETTVGEDDDSDADDEDAALTKKEPRMKTNKKKSLQFLLWRQRQKQEPQ